MYKRLIKRVLDFCISLIAIIILSPIFLIVTLMLLLANKGAGVFFIQTRPGHKCKPFKLIKFKTMTDEKDEFGVLLPDIKRLTPIGKIIRSLSIDELPQLINILKGEMSLIGPRPLLMKYLPLYTPEQMRRHEVRPGITGWAQVHGRNLLKLSKKFEYDVWYVDHCTFVTDLKVLWLTVLKVIKRSDIGDGNATMQDVDDLHFMDRLNSINNGK